MDSSDVAAFLLTRTKLGREIPAELLAIADIPSLSGLGPIDGTAAQVLLGRGVAGAELAAKLCTDPVWLAKRVSGESRVGVLRELARNPHVPDSAIHKLHHKVLNHKEYVAQVVASLWKRMTLEEAIDSYAAMRSAEHQSAYYAAARHIDVEFGLLVSSRANLETLRQHKNAPHWNSFNVVGMTRALLAGRPDLSDDIVVELLSFTGNNRIAVYQELLSACRITLRHALLFESLNLNGSNPMAAFTRTAVLGVTAPPPDTFEIDETAALSLATSPNEAARTLVAFANPLSDEVFNLVIDNGTSLAMLAQLVRTTDVDRVIRILEALPDELEIEPVIAKEVMSKVAVPRPHLYRLLGHASFSVLALLASTRGTTERTASGHVIKELQFQRGDFAALTARSDAWTAAFLRAAMNTSWDDIPDDVATEFIEQTPGLARYAFRVDSPLAAHLARYLDETFGNDSGAAALFLSLAPTWSATVPSLIDSVRSLR